VPGQGAAINDHLAMQSRLPEVLDAAFELEDCPSTAPVCVAPISLRATALEEATLTRAARMEVLSVAWAMSIQIYMVIDHHQTGAGESGAEVTEPICVVRGTCAWGLSTHCRSSPGRSPLVASEDMEWSCVRPCLLVIAAAAVDPLRGAPRRSQRGRAITTKLALSRRDCPG
jgi:hypothetical protein